MKIQQISIDEAIKSLNSSLNGLTEDEAKKRLKEYGPNLIEEVKKEHIIIRFLKQFTSFFAVILWIAAGLAFLAEHYSPGQGMPTLGYAIIGVIIVNGLFSFWQEYRSEKAIESLKKLLPQIIEVIRNNKVKQIPASELVPGDIITLDEGNKIPADCRLIEAFSINVNNATITGESFSQARNTEATSEEDLLRCKNILLAGTYMISGEGKALVFATGLHTEFGKIASLTQTAREAVYPLQKEISYISRFIFILATIIGISFILIGQLLGMDLKQGIIFGIGIIIALVPEGLLPTVTLSLAMASKRMAERNALVRHLPAVETLGSATVICTDKTGTLTENKMAVKKIILGDKQYDIKELNKQSEAIKTYRLFFEAALFCQNVKEAEKENKKVYVGDPMEAALVQMAKNILPNIPNYPRIDEVPFDTDRKRMSVLYKTSEGLILYTKGAAETLLSCCKYVKKDSKEEPLTDQVKEELLKIEESFAENGLRVLAFAYRHVPEKYDKEHLEEELTFLGFVGLEDPPRPEVPDAIKQCQNAKIKVIMITGDHPKTAIAIGREIGLIKSDNPVVINGDQLRKLSNIQLRILLDSKEIIFARIGADQKMQIVNALKQKNQIVAVTGDGVNDAPALKSANIGIAMGVTGTDVAKEAADIVLMDDNFASIVKAIEEGRAVYENIRKFLTYILTVDFAELIPYLAYSLFKIPLALTILQILSIDLGSNTLPALALGAEKPDPDIMNQAPRLPNERLINRYIILRAYLFLGIIEAIAAMSIFFFVLYQGGWVHGIQLANNNLLYKQVTTAYLSTLVIMQVINLFLCRSRKESVFTKRFFDNRLIFYGVIFEIAVILLIDYTYPGNIIFGTAPIHLTIWLLMLPFALGMLILEEFRKWIVRKFIKTN